MLLLAGALVLAGAAVALLAGLGLAGTRTGPGRTRPLGGMGGPAAVVAGLGLVAAVALAAGLLVTRGTGGDGAAGPAPPRPTAPSPRVASPGDGGTGGDPGGAVELGPVVRLIAEPAGDGAEWFPDAYPAADGLPAPTVLQVRVGGFPGFARAQARQCVIAGEVVCTAPVPVQFGEQGAAAFQFLVGDAFARGAGSCRAGAPPCKLVVEEVGGATTASLQTVFGDTLPPPGRIRVTPRTGLVDGQRVTVTVEGYPPGVRVQAMLCAPPDATGTRRCGPPGPTAPLQVRADGTGSTRLEIRSGPVGSLRVPCGWREVCGITVASDELFARAPVVEIRFAAPPGASYQTGRLAAGLAIAVLLLGAAVGLMLRTDWSPPDEAAAPEIDEAEYADLDALVAALPPEDAGDEAGQAGGGAARGGAAGPGR